MTEFDSEI